MTNKQSISAQPFAGLALLTDLDGTLLTPEKQVAPEDAAAIAGFRCSGATGLILTAEAAVLVLALWRFTPRTRRAVSLAACAAAAAALPCVFAEPLLSLANSPGQLIAVLALALLAAAPGLCARVGREAQT